MSTPTVFLSAASDDLRDWRDILHKAFERGGCKVYTQGHSLGAAPRGVPELLCEHLDKSDFVIHLAGLAYGSEPELPPFASHPDFRCSYTQFEYYYAHQHEKQVIAFVCAEDFPYLAFTEKGNDDDRERRRLLQVAHRDRVAHGKFDGTPLDGHAHRTLNESIADESKLLEAVAAAVGTIHACAGQCAAAIQEELKELATKRHEELLDYIKDLPSRVVDELERRRLIQPAVEFKADISRIIKYAPAELIGREAETKLLGDAWELAVSGEKERPHVLTFVALGGEGKTSLVAKWAAELAHQDWPGCEAVFAWSFYSQGTREQLAASSDLFLATALNFFGDPDMAASPQGAFEKGQRLAQLVGQRRALLILDGLEPLQFAPTSPTPGQLKDQGVAALLTGLAGSSRGLCVVTTRYSIPDLKTFWQTTAPEHALQSLSIDAGVDLLQRCGVQGTREEFEKLVEDVKGHALTLNLIGTYLRDAHAGDIRRRDLVQLAEADEEEQSGHAFRVLDAYVEWFEQKETEGTKNRSESFVPSVSFCSKSQRALALLRLMGLFDRPASADCLEALWSGEPIAGLTESLIGISEPQRNLSLTRLEDAKLLTVNRDGAGTLVSLDAHPLIREYFARELQVGRQQALRSSGSPGDDAGESRDVGDRDEGDAGTAQGLFRPTAWRAAHRRLYEHLCATTPDKPDATLEDLQPLYQAVAHGCQAGLQQEAYSKVCQPRIWRRNEVYTVKKLGAFGSDLGAIACFFEQPWSRLSPSLTEADQAFIFNCAAFCLRALGRLTEALEPMRVSGEMDVKVEQWNGAAISFSNLSELELTLGEVAGAVARASRSVTYADRSGDAFQRMSNRTAHADALHQAGRRDEAESLFREAEQMQAERQPTYPLLYSLQGFRYCDLMLGEAEREAWQIVAFRSAKDAPERCFRGAKGDTDLLESCRAVSDRATQTLKWEEGMRGAPLLDFALHHLTLGRAALYAAILQESEISDLKSEIEQAVSGLRRAGTTHHIPRGLLTRAWLRFLSGECTGPESAQSDLDEAWEIAARGPMPLFMAEVCLYRARLFGRPEKGSQESESRSQNYPWQSPEHDLAEARRLIEKCGYWRRKEELEDAEALLRGKIPNSDS